MHRCAALALSAALAAAATASAPAPPPVVVPTDGMRIAASARFAAGTYALPHGVSVVADGVTLDLGGAELVGDGAGNGAGVTVAGVANVTVTSSLPGAALRGFFYGVVATDVSGFALSDCSLSGNWRAPNASSTWLDINAPPSLADRVNLGGGLFLRGARGADVARVNASGAENGFDIYDSRGVAVRDSTASDNQGWGVHFYNTTDSAVLRNVLDRNIRENDGDSAGILLVYGSHRNRVAENSCQFSGDGFFIGNENGCPSNFNVVEDNDCSHANANAFEATFSNGNIFRRNRAVSTLRVSYLARDIGHFAPPQRLTCVSAYTHPTPCPRSPSRTMGFGWVTATTRRWRRMRLWAMEMASTLTTGNTTRLRITSSRTRTAPPCSSRATAPRISRKCASPSLTRPRPRRLS
jgi:hypothetical protein